MNLRVFRIFFALCGALALAASAAAQTGGGERPAETYRIREGDRLSVRFLNHPELNEPNLAVRPDGFISLQMIDDLKTAGLTTAELRAKIARAYDEILLNPVISVNVVEFVPPAVFIGGQIARPGKYLLRDGDSLVKVIFLAGGFTRDANRRMVLYARPDAAGRWQVREINVLRLLEKMSGGEDLALADGDYIFVPDSKLSKFNKALEGFQSFFPFIPLL